LKTRNANLSSGLFLVFLSGAVAYKAWHLGVGRISNPQPGFMFFYSSLLLGLLGLLLFLVSLWAKEGAKQGVTRTRVWRVMPVFLGFLLYILLFIPLGYLLSTFLFLTFLFGLRQPGGHRWFFAAGSSALTVAVTYLVFVKLFLCPLPKGIIHF
jgi:hypothetical protein